MDNLDINGQRVDLGSYSDRLQSILPDSSSFSPTSSVVGKCRVVECGSLNLNFLLFICPVSPSYLSIGVAFTLNNLYCVFQYPGCLKEEFRVMEKELIEAHPYLLF